MNIIIIPEQIVKNPNFKPILVVKEQSTFFRTKYISMFNVISLQQKLNYSQLSVCLQNIIIQDIYVAKKDHNKNVETVSFKLLNLINRTLHKYQ